MGIHVDLDIDRSKAIYRDGCAIDQVWVQSSTEIVHVYDCVPSMQPVLYSQTVHKDLVCKRFLVS